MSKRPAKSMIEEEFGQPTPADQMSPTEVPPKPAEPAPQPRAPRRNPKS